MLSALTLGVLCVIAIAQGRFPTWSLYLAPLALSSINAFFSPAKNAAIPRLVPESQLLEANSLNAAIQNLMPLIGIGLSGAVLGTLWEASGGSFFLVSVALNGLTFLLSAVFIRRLPDLPSAKATVETSTWTETRQGLLYIAGDHFLRMALILSLFANLMIAPFMVAYIKANDAWFGGRYVNLAAFEFAFMVGMVVSSLLVAKLGIRRVGLSCVMGFAVVGIAVALMAFGGFWFFILWNLIAGLALPFAQIPLSTYIQITVPDTFRGRVNGALVMVSMGIQPLGMSLGGLLLDRIGLVAMFLVMGIGFCFAATAGLFDVRFRGAEIPAASEPVSDEMKGAGEVAAQA
jgi:MFS family permease